MTVRHGSHGECADPAHERVRLNPSVAFDKLRFSNGASMVALAALPRSCSSGLNPARHTRDTLLGQEGTYRKYPAASSKRHRSGLITNASVVLVQFAHCGYVIDEVVK